MHFTDIKKKHQMLVSFAHKVKMSACVKCKIFLVILKKSFVTLYPNKHLLIFFNVSFTVYPN